MSGGAWIVGRGDDGCYVEHGEPQQGEQKFDSEHEAVTYAVACEADAAATLRRSINRLRARLRRIDRRPS